VLDSLEERINAMPKSSDCAVRRSSVEYIAT